MPNPNQKYNSGGVPYGGFYTNIFRLADPTDNASGVALVDPTTGQPANYLVESCTPQDGAKLEKRPGVDAGKNGWWIVGMDVEGNATIQRNVETTPSVTNGDYFTASVRVGADGTPVAERFVIHSPSQEVGASYRRFNCSVIVDSFA